MNGKILDSVGFTKVDGARRTLEVKEQLIRMNNFVGINEIVHPVHGRIVVDRSKLDELLKFDNHHLYRFKLSMFV